MGAQADGSKDSGAKPGDADVAPHGFRDDSLVLQLHAKSVRVIADPIGRLNDDKRLEGHTTHNFFVHDKKDKGKRFLVTVRQASHIDMKALAGVVGTKEL